MMKNKLKKSILINFTFILFLILSSSGFSLTPENQNITIKSQHIWDVVYTKQAELYVEKKFLTETEIYEIAERIETGINKVKEYFNVNSDYQQYRIWYFIKSGVFASSVRSRTIELSFIKEKRAPYLHETVHVITNNELGVSAVWLLEGVATYLNDYLGGYPCFPNFGEDLDKLTMKILSNSKFTEVLSFDAKYNVLGMDRDKMKMRQVFDILSGSLVKYIEKTYGRQVLIDIYKNQDYYKMTEKTFEQIKNDWLEYLRLQK